MFFLDSQLILTLHSVGDPPYDRVTIFGKAQFDNTVFSCEAVEGGQSCSQSDDVTAPIDRTIAKR